MYMHPTTQKSLTVLQEMGVAVLKTENGLLACGEIGQGRFLEPEDLVKEIESHLSAEKNKKMNLRKILITAGGTSERIDDIRKITNTSTGKSGIRLANRLACLGHQVTLLKAKFAKDIVFNKVNVIEFESHADLSEHVRKELSESFYEQVIHMAAVSDFQVDHILIDGHHANTNKISSESTLTLQLRPTTKILNSMRQWSKNKNILITAFKLTSAASKAERALAAQKILEHANEVISNDLSEIDDSKGLHPYIVFKKNQQPLHLLNWDELAQKFDQMVAYDSLS
jgi:phosphopantothenoylcysteine decarboxylase / phosphopantothenate---cysteine ligase